jgi:cytochrome c6
VIERVDLAATAVRHRQIPCLKTPFSSLRVNECNGSQLARFSIMRLFICSTIAALLTISISGPPNKEDSGKEAEVFQEQCIGCHGPDGRAQTEMGKKMGAADLTSAAVQQQSDSSLLKTVKDGKEKMPAFESKLSGDEIHAVIAYIRELGKKR